MKKLIITGNVGRDPEIRVSNDGTEFATFSVGISVGTRDKPRTDWVDVVCNGKLLELARNYIRKGGKVLVEGYPSVNCFLSRQNKPMGSLRVHPSHIELLTRRELIDPEAKDDEEEFGQDMHNLPISNPLEGDDIPF